MVAAFKFFGKSGKLRDEFDCEVWDPRSTRRAFVIAYVLQKAYQVQICEARCLTAREYWLANH